MPEIHSGGGCLGRLHVWTEIVSQSHPHCVCVCVLSSLRNFLVQHFFHVNSVNNSYTNARHIFSVTHSHTHALYTVVETGTSCRQVKDLYTHIHTHRTVVCVRMTRFLGVFRRLLSRGDNAEEEDEEEGTKKTKKSDTAESGQTHTRVFCTNLIVLSMVSKRRHI